MGRRALGWGLVVLFAAAGCGDDDASAPDGSVPPDAGARDGGAPPDAARGDAGPFDGGGRVEGLLPDERRIPWEPGLPDGIPAYAQAIDVTAAPYGARGDGTTDDTSAIQRALDDCPTDRAVFLPAGTYRVTSTIQMPSHCVLRGAGMGTTTIRGDDAGQDLVELGGSLSYGYFYDGWAGTWVPLTADATKGASTISVGDASTFHVGDLVLVDERNDPALVDANGTEGLCDYCGRESGGRVVGQVVRVTAVAGGTVTVDPPIAWTFHTALGAEAKAMPSDDVVQWSGLEDLTITQDTAGSMYSVYMSGMFTWLRGVEITNIDWRAVWMAWNLRSEIRDCYFHTAVGDYCHSLGYAVTLSLQSTANLVENNVFDHVCYSAVVFGGALANVIAYNYSGITEYSFSSDWLVAAYGSHGAHPAHNLWEGNVGNKFYDDFIHGSASHEVLFRNHLRGEQVGRADANIAIGFEQKNTRMSVLGNVLGVAGHTSVYEQRAPGPFDTWMPTIYALGDPDDLEVVATILRRANWDAAHGCTWDDAAGACLDAAGLAAVGLPASLYLDGPPAWWNDAPFPPFGPDPASPGAARVSTIPAEARFHALTGR